MIAKWIIFGLFGLTILLVISSIGKPRAPITPAIAVRVAIINAAYMTAIFLWWH